MVLSAFIGIRKHVEAGRQEIRVTPLQVVIIGIMAAALFVVAVKTVVKLVIG